MSIVTINESATRRYARTIAQAAAKLEAAGLTDEAQALRNFAATRVEQARRTAAASNPDLSALADQLRPLLPMAGCRVYPRRDLGTVVVDLTPEAAEKLIDVLTHATAAGPGR